MMTLEYRSKVLKLIDDDPDDPDPGGGPLLKQAKPLPDGEFGSVGDCGPPDGGEDGGAFKLLYSKNK